MTIVKNKNEYLVYKYIALPIINTIQSGSHFIYLKINTHLPVVSRVKKMRIKVNQLKFDQIKIKKFSDNLLFDN